MFGKNKCRSFGRLDSKAKRIRIRVHFGTLSFRPQRTKNSVIYFCQAYFVMGRPIRQTLYIYLFSLLSLNICLACLACSTWVYAVMFVMLFVIFIYISSIPFMSSWIDDDMVCYVGVFLHFTFPSCYHNFNICITCCCKLICRW